MINPIYKFEIEVTHSGSTTITRRVYPVYGEGLTKEWTQESGERFFRETLSGELNFSGADYDFIIGYPFGREFRLTVYYSDNMGAGWTRYWRGRFTLTDCTVNEDDRTITVTPTPVDAYDKILAGMEKEFDLIKLLPEMTALQADKRPLLQVYRAGERVVGCYMAGMWWEQECARVYDRNALESDYYFYPVRRVTCVDLHDYSLPPLPDRSRTIYANSDGSVNFSFTMDGYTYEQQVSTNIDSVVYDLFLYEGTDRTRGWRHQEVRSGNTPKILEGTFTFESFGGAYGYFDVTINDIDIWSRILTDVYSYNGVPTHNITDDFAPVAQHYARAAGYGDSSIIYFSIAKTSNPTEWGIFRDNLYYMSPVGSLMGGEAFPMARNGWDAASLWFIPPVLPWDTYGVTRYTIKNAYPLASVIQKLLAQIDPTISYFDDSTGSQFFHATDIEPYFNYRLFITPKSNALSAGYDIPAMKGPITLRQVFDMLRDCFRCYWYIEGSSLKIEHARYFDNGKSYTGGSAGIGVDLTTLSVRRTGKSWDTEMGRYTFDKESLPDRYQFGWMDGVSKPFEGYALDIDSPYVDAGKIEDIKVTAFTSDLDFMVCAGGECSKDGFALLCGAADANGIYKVPYFAVHQEDIDYNLQNGPLSFTYLQRYYRYDLPAVDYTINGVAMQALGLKRPKKQSVVFPTHNDPDPLRLIKTSLGNGVVEKMSVNLSSRKAEAELSYGAI